jgi:hypothetical protein
LAQIALVDFSDIAISDESNMIVDRGESASIVLTSTPGSSPVATSLASLFQNNLVGLRAIRQISWTRIHDYSVSVMSIAC